MKKLYLFYIGLVLCLLILSLVCGPHSCEWGNEVYFFFGFGALLILLFMPFFRKKLNLGQKVGSSLGISLLWVLLWVGGLVLGDFMILCRLF